ncbi:hypothetical protein DN585_14975 [Intrasporangium calvum]|nr:hypothetical protein DN585_14975 [Intrasporangium calvum]
MDPPPSAGAGLHAKWLDATSRRSLIEQLAAIPTLRLRERTAQTRITYLDPEHVAGRRRWDIATAGGQPLAVVLAQRRPHHRESGQGVLLPTPYPRRRGVLGNGDAVVNLIAGVQPLVGAAAVIYWGEMDADGLQIVSRLRGRGHPVDTILMELHSFVEDAAYCTRFDQHGKVIPAGNPVPPPHLTDDEAALYRHLTGHGRDGPRRVEQERIPLTAAVNAVRRHLVWRGSASPSAVLSGA